MAWKLKKSKATEESAATVAEAPAPESSDYSSGASHVPFRPDAEDEDFFATKVNAADEAIAAFTAAKQPVAEKSEHDDDWALDAFAPYQPPDKLETEGTAPTLASFNPNAEEEDFLPLPESAKHDHVEQELTGTFSEPDADEDHHRDVLDLGGSAESTFSDADWQLGVAHSEDETSAEEFAVNHASIDLDAEPELALEPIAEHSEQLVVETAGSNGHSKGHAMPSVAMPSASDFLDEDEADLPIAAMPLPPLDSTELELEELEDEEETKVAEPIALGTSFREPEVDEDRTIATNEFAGLTASEPEVIEPVHETEPTEFVVAGQDHDLAPVSMLEPQLSIPPTNKPDVPSAAVITDPIERLPIPPPVSVVSAATVEPYARLVIRLGAFSATYDLKAGDIVIGRPDPNTGASPEISVEWDDAISRRHAHVFAQGVSYYLADLGSKNGTKLNGTLLPSETPAMLHTGDRIRIGEKTEIIFEANE